jgi:hypothetical protein
MMNRNLSRRLERLLVREVPKTPRVLKILVTSIGEPDRTVELVLDEPYNRRRGFWQGNRENDK